jgi:hypothetical protein
MQKPHFDTSVSYTVYYHLHNKTIKVHDHVHSILLVISTTGIKRIEAKLTQKNQIVKRWYIVKVASKINIKEKAYILFNRGHGPRMYIFVNDDQIFYYRCVRLSASNKGNSLLTIVTCSLWPAKKNLLLFKMSPRIDTPTTLNLFNIS